MSIKQLVVTCLNRKDCKYMNTSASLCLIKSTISTKKIKVTKLRKSKQLVMARVM